MSKQRGMHGIPGSEGATGKSRNAAKDAEKENSEPHVMSDGRLHSHDIHFLRWFASVERFSELKWKETKKNHFLTKALNLNSYTFSCTITWI